MSELKPFDPAAIGASTKPRAVSWTSRDCMLYALGVGAGVDDLAFTTNNTANVPQRMVPTMPVTLGVDFSVLKEAGEFSWAGLLHAEQRIELLAELPVEGSAQAVTRITEMWDKGKAAVVTAETTGTSPDGTELWRSAATLFVKGVGGWGGDRGPSSEAIEPEGPVKTISYETRSDQALIYRLSGDYNPLHSDPAFARKAGMDRPILHGLCTFGFAGRAVLEFSGEEAPLRSMSARFAGPVWPGDSLHVDLWQADNETIRFVVRGRDDKAVLTNGIATLGA